MIPSRILVGALTLCVLLPAATSGQTVLVRVLDDETSGPLVGALAYLEDAGEETVKSTLTDDRGRALFVGIPSGRYRVRVEMIGMGTTETGVFDISPGATVTEEVRMEASAIELEGIEVEAEGGRCTVRPGAEGAFVAQVWDEARKALSAASLTDERGRYRYEIVKYDRQIDRETGVVLDEERTRREGYMDTPFESYPAEDLVQKGFVQEDGRDHVYMAPDASVLLSDPFLDTHCFRVEESGDESSDLIGLRFEPTGENKTVPDISGTLWLDSQTAELRWLEYTYEYLEPERTSDQVGGRVDFRRMPDGTWIVPEWWIRMPVMTSQTDFEGRERAYIARYHQTGGLVRSVREAGGRSLGQTVRTGGVEGVVMDSLGVPLPGVRVGVIGSSQEVYTDAEGSFSITGLTEGRYHVRFVDPALEAVGYIPPPVERDVIPAEVSQMEYHMPSRGDVLFEACRGVEKPEGSVALVGSVVDGFGRPVPDAQVRVQWRSYDVRGGGRLDVSQARNLREITEGVELTTDVTGVYSFCGLPPEETVEVSAFTAELESGIHELVIPDYETGAMRVLELTQAR
ncbi:MAG: carboxypeptidase regulatory-like domain-containing protein [Longimicrobiales bacterium]|nr:carboxypeptidase regulatory-like domain-containing protein [Longimicrobiales bacterium]